MRYSTVTFKPKVFEHGEWWVTFEDLPYDRESGNGSLSGLGFFHYPRKLGRKAAFEKLKAHMIEKHQEEIDRLMKSMESIRRIEMPNMK